MTRKGSEINFVVKSGLTPGIKEPLHATVSRFIVTLEIRFGHLAHIWFSSNVCNAFKRSLEHDMLSKISK